MPPGSPGSPVPPPPDLARVTPLEDTWPAGRALVRVFTNVHAPDAFNPGRGSPTASGRFHFFADRAGRVVPVLYGADQEDGAIAETVFHDVPVAGPGRVVRASRLDALSLTVLRPTRDLRLVQLLGHGLRRLGIRATNLTDTEASEYQRTVAWARALHDALPRVDGLLWMSRQFNAARALVLFGDRVAPGALAVAEPPLPLSLGRGRSLVDRAANAAGVTVV
jgi:hypothetical protein